MARWIDSVKVALLEGDSQRAFDMTQALPDFGVISDEEEKLETMRSVLELISQTVQMLEREQEDVRCNMSSIRQAKKFFS